MKALEISLLSSPYTTVKLKWTGLPYRSYSFLCLHIVSLSKFEDLIWHTVVFSFIDAFFSFFGVLTGQKGFQRGELRETGVIAGSTNFSSNKRLLRHQSSKTSRVMELKHESITLSSLVRRALNPTCSILICYSREGGGVLAPGFLRSLYRRVQGILRSLILVTE